MVRLSSFLEVIEDMRQMAQTVKDVKTGLRKAAGVQRNRVRNHERNRERDMQNLLVEFGEPTLIDDVGDRALELV